LFIIKTEFYDTYLSNSLSLYKTLENLYSFTSNNYKFGLTLYTQLCELHKTGILEEYFKEKGYKKEKGYYKLFSSITNEKTYIKIRASVIEIKTNKNIPNIFKILNYYNSKMFICDFNRGDYFWLQNHYRRKYYN
jgi:hypothetical protein